MEMGVISDTNMTHVDDTIQYIHTYIHVYIYIYTHTQAEKMMMVWRWA